MKSSKTHKEKTWFLVPLICLFGLAWAMPETLLEAVHANRVSHKQKKLMRQMLKLHRSLTNLDPRNLNETNHTTKKNEYLKQFRKKKSTKK